MIRWRNSSRACLSSGGFSWGWGCPTGARRWACSGMLGGWRSFPTGRSLLPDEDMSLRFARSLLLGQLEFIFQAQGEFVEQIGQAGTVGFFVAQDVHLAIERGGGVAAQLVNLGGNGLGVFEQLGAKLALAVGHLLFERGEFFLDDLGAVFDLARNILEALGALGFFGLQAR